MIDAFVVRMTLVPAVMALLGDRAWWHAALARPALPHFDIEGEAVEREITLADWPEPNTTAAVVADGLGVSAGDVRLVDDVALRVEPGAALVVTAADPRRPRALLLALAGRATLEGRARVGGHLLPGREAWVRTHVGVALLDGSSQPVRELKRALGGRPRIVVIDALDAVVAGPAHDQAAAALRDAAAATPGLTLLVASTHPDAARALLADAGWTDSPVLDLTAHSGSPRRDAASDAALLTVVPTTEVKA